ncbi:hypothetical protein BDP27DRAFT_1243497 [Rhodocollybia butyracea]|uniref:Integrase core domain-containing protein n=1 Tax=Rhodocollybia butyracea TaxID=206335 RepID=A0A9P5P8M5_9AGAR|nr:hypothetical protein BDP27DRAFT_1243497 [Rhodocollybia butyracea]
MTDLESEITSQLLDGLGGLSDQDSESNEPVAPVNTSNNRFGKNQHKNCPPKNDEKVHAALLEYHRRNITNKETISKLLKIEHGITLASASVTRRKKHLGIQGSGVTTRSMEDLDKRQLVLDEMANDPNGKRGPRVIKEILALKHNVHLTRDFIEATMREEDSDGFKARDPTAKKIKRSVLVCLGPHHEWSGDGHDKLTAIGFPIWGVRDVWSGKWLGLWVVPNNRLKETIGYLFLKLVHEYGGMPIQMTTDCGSELVTVYGFANALREEFASDLPIDILPPHKFLQSIHNITIERGWLRLRLDWGENVKIFWDAGSGIYNASDPQHDSLVRWLWPTLIQAELDGLKDRFNNHRVRKDRGKYLPSGTSPNIAFALYQQYEGDFGLQAADRNVIAQLMEDMGGEDLIRFVSVEYATKAQQVYDSLDLPKLAMNNIWDVFQAMLPHM